MENESAGEGLIGEKRFPFVGNIRAKVRDDGVKACVRCNCRPVNFDPIWPANREKALIIPKRKHAEQRTLAAKPEIDCEIPTYANQETADELDAAIVNAREEKNGEDQPVAYRIRWQYAVRRTDTGMKRGLAKAEIAQRQRDDRPNQRICETLMGRRLLNQQAGPNKAGRSPIADRGRTETGSGSTPSVRRTRSLSIA